jgi:phage shock protein E
MNTISGEKACEILKDGGKLVDVRTVAEFNQGYLPGAINLPLQQIMAADNMFEKDDHLVLYCVSGARTASAKQYLDQMGYKNVHDLGSFQNYICE